MSRSRWLLKRGRLTPHILENDVVEEITARLWLQYRIKVWRVRERIPGEGVAPSTAGIPDLVGWLKVPHTCIMAESPAVFKATVIPFTVPLFIECKRPGGAHRTAQTRFIEGAKSDGCVAFFAECWGDVVREFEAVGIKLKEAA